MQKSVFSAVTAPASNLEMSSRVPSSASTLSSAPWMRPTNSRSLSGSGSFGERGDEQPCRIQRLQQVVAGGGEEAGLAEVRLLRVGLGQPQRLLDCRALEDFLTQLAVQLGQLGSSLDDAPFQTLLRFLKLFGRVLALGDVGVGDDEAATRHRVAPYFEDGAVGEALLHPQRLAAAVSSSATAECASRP